MIILDANILLYAYDVDSPQNHVAAAWLEALLASREAVGIPWQTIWAFLRIRTNAKLAIHPRPARESIAIVEEWLALPGVTVIQPGPRHAQILAALIVENGAVGPLVSDAAMAALAIEYGATLASAHRDFDRFPELRWVNPLA